MNHQESYRKWLAEQRNPPATPMEPQVVVQPDQAGLLAYAATLLGVPIAGASETALLRLLQWVPTPAGSTEARQLFLEDLATLLAVLPRTAATVQSEYEALAQELISGRWPPERP